MGRGIGRKPGVGHEDRAERDGHQGKMGSERGGAGRQRDRIVAEATLAVAHAAARGKLGGAQVGLLAHGGPGDVLAAADQRVGGEAAREVGRRREGAGDDGGEAVLAGERAALRLRVVVSCGRRGAPQVATFPCTADGGKAITVTITSMTSIPTRMACSASGGLCSMSAT